VTWLTVDRDFNHIWLVRPELFSAAVLAFAIRVCSSCLLNLALDVSCAAATDIANLLFSFTNSSSLTLFQLL